MNKEFEGKLALITGAASGIGRATAYAFAERGAKVVVADVDMKGGEAVAANIRDKGGHAIFVRTNVTKSAEVQNVVNEAVRTYGSLDYAYNAVGIIPKQIAKTADFKEEDWDLLLDVNLKSVWLCMKYEIQQMLKQGAKAAIVNTASISGISAHPADPGYVSSKFGVVGLTKTAALEYAKTNIRINCICPGPTETALLDQVLRQVPGSPADTVPMGRVARPEEMAEAVVWLCSDAASFITAVALPVDGGRTAM